MDSLVCLKPSLYATPDGSIQFPDFTKMPRRHHGCDGKEVWRMLNPRHPTKLRRIKEALDVLGKRLVVSVEEAA